MAIKADFIVPPSAKVMDGYALCQGSGRPRRQIKEITLGLKKKLRGKPAHGRSRICLSRPAPGRKGHDEISPADQGFRFGDGVWRQRDSQGRSRSEERRV